MAELVEPCICGCCVIGLGVDADGPFPGKNEQAVWYFNLYTLINFREITFRERLKLAWDILRGLRAYPWDCTLTQTQAGRIANYILSYGEKSE